MQHPRLVQWSALASCGVLLYVAATRMPAVNAGRRELNMMGAASPIASAPPEYAFAVQAFGAFRGLVTDIAFIRAEQYKEEGRYYDAMQLAKWICLLQPHFPTVWEFASWNMAWNISVTTYTAEERWNWVYNGVKLLRDEGIPYNPRAVNLYKQLAWTYVNKMSETMDDFHLAYKVQWAWRMHLLLGPPPQPLEDVNPEALAAEVRPEAEADLLAQAGRHAFEENEQKLAQAAAERGEFYRPRDYEAVKAARAGSGPETSSFEITKKADADFIRNIDQAPRRLADLYAKFPAARQMVDDLRELGISLNDDTLTEDEYWRDGGLAFTFFEPYRALCEPTALLAVVTGAPAANARGQQQLDALDRILGVRAGNSVGRALVRWLQYKVLTEVYKLEPEYMVQVIDSFGPVDWRSVDAQSLYWVTKGLVMSGETVNNFRNDRTNTARILFFTLRNLFLRNRITFEPFAPRIELSYIDFNRDLNFIEPMHQAYVKYGPLFDPRPGGIAGAGATFEVGHINFLTEAIRLLYISGHEREAQHYYDYLRDNYPNSAAGERNPAYVRTLHDFVMDSYFESLSEPGLREIRIAIDGLLTLGYRELADGNVTRYTRLVQRAREFQANYNSRNMDKASARLRLPDFVDLQTDALGSLLAPPAVTPQMALHKVRLWRAVPLYLRQAVYDELAAGFAAECNAFGFDVTRAYPEPAGMEDYRRAHPQRAKPGEKPDEVETLPQKTNG